MAPRRRPKGSPPTPSITDLKAGSEEAWQRAVTILGPPLRGFASLRGSDDPDETLAQVFLDLARGIDDLDGDWETFRTLAFVIARRRIVDVIRYNTRRPTEPYAPGDLDGRNIGGNVEQEAMSNLDREWLLELLDVLTPIQRDVLTMRIVSGLTVREVADVIDSSETAVKANQRRAISSLRRHLAETGADTTAPMLAELATELGVTR